MQGRLSAVAGPVAIAVAMLVPAWLAAPAEALPTSNCSRTEPDTTTACPRVISGSAEVAKTLGASTGRWGTAAPPISFAAQWQSCTGTTPGSCTNIAGETDLGHLVSPADLGLRLRLVITASDGAPGSDKRASLLTDVVVENPGDSPGKSQTFVPTVGVVAPGIAAAPHVGDTLHVPNGSGPTPASDGWFDPPAEGLAFRWRRCNADGALASCETLQGPGGRDYVLTEEDMGHALRARVVGTNAAGSQALLSAATAAIGPAPVVPSAPATEIPVISPAPISLPDLLPPTLDSLFLTSPAFRVGRSAGSGTDVSFELSEPATVELSAMRSLIGIKRDKRCVKLPRPAPAHAEGCARRIPVKGTIAQAGVSGFNRLHFTGRLTGRQLQPGAYQLLAVAIDAAGNRSLAPVSQGFRILAPTTR
jgi:hypothetical protein